MATMSSYTGAALVGGYPTTGPTTGLASDASGASVSGDYARIDNMGSIRVTQALLVVLAHTIGWSYNESIQSLSALGRMSVPFFFFVAAFLLVIGLRKRPAKSWLTMCVERSHRLLVPFLFWSAVFVAMKAGYAWFSGSRDPTDFLNWKALTVGGSGHLWFIPALLISSVAAFPLVSWALRHRSGAALLGLSSLVAGLAIGMVNNPFLIGSEVSSTNEEAFQLVQWWHRFPAFLFGLCCGLWWTPTMARLVKSNVLGLAGVIGFAACAAWLVMYGQRSSLIESVAGVCLFLAGAGALLSNCLGPVAGWLDRLGGYSYGVYLIHPLFCWGLLIVLGRTGLMAHDWAAFVLFAATLVASFLAVGVARKFKIAQSVLPA